MTRKNIAAMSFALGFALFAWLVLHNVWINDDAFISFRVADNALHGYGLTWNTDERVQGYTNPLWVLLHIPALYLLGDIYTATIALSLLCSYATFFVVLRPYWQRPFYAWVMLIGPLCLSRAMVYYASSGLENPLTFLLLALFAHIYLRNPVHIPWGRLSLLASLAAVNRLDTLLCYLPAMAYLLCTQRRAIRWLPLCLGAVPLAGWLLFALLYYGFLLPNTYYAKLGVGIPQQRFLLQGLFYFLHLFRHDILTALCLVAANGTFCILAWRKARSHAHTLALLAAVPLYSAYILWIGGDFMSGRYWAAPFLLTLITAAHALKEKDTRPLLQGFACLQMAAAAITLYATPAPTTNKHYISEEHDFYLRMSPLESHPMLPTDEAWAKDGLAQRALTEAQAKANPGVDFDTQYKRVVPKGSIGMYGYYAGPHVYIIDNFALTDPLLARLPTSLTFFRIGHFWRDTPDGYMEARSIGNLSRMDPALAEYYSHLRLITSGPLWSAERLMTIMRFNLGMYDHLRQDYISRSIDHYYYLRKQRSSRQQ